MSTKRKLLWLYGAILGALSLTICLLTNYARAQCLTCDLDGNCCSTGALQPVFMNGLCLDMCGEKGGDGCACVAGLCFPETMCQDPQSPFGCQMTPFWLNISQEYFCYLSSGAGLPQYYCGGGDPSCYYGPYWLGPGIIRFGCNQCLSG